MIFKKLNGIELGWKCFAYQAKKIREGMIQQKKNGIELGQKCFGSKAKKKEGKGMIPTKNKWH